MGNIEYPYNSIHMQGKEKMIRKMPHVFRDRKWLKFSPQMTSAKVKLFLGTQLFEQNKTGKQKSMMSLFCIMFFRKIHHTSLSIF